MLPVVVQLREQLHLRAGEAKKCIEVTDVIGRPCCSLLDFALCVINLSLSLSHRLVILAVTEQLGGDCVFGHVAVHHSREVPVRGVALELVLLFRPKGRLCP